ncbi:MAG: M28 family peptidase [Flavobacteriales bacterium]|jgi:hypothetical protein
MRNGILSVLLGLMLSSSVQAQLDSVALRYANTITVEELRDHLVTLSSDAFMGRDTGKDGQKMAAAYLKKEIIGMGIPPVPAHDPGSIVDGYYQQYELIESRIGTIRVTGNGQELSFMKELLYFSESLADARTVSEVVYMGNGTTMAETKGLRGKVVMIDDPGAQDMAMMIALRMSTDAATKAGAEVLLIPTKRIEQLKAELGHYATSSRMRLATDVPEKEKETRAQLILIDADAMEGMLGKWKLNKLSRRSPGKRVKVDMTIAKGESGQRVLAENVLAYIEGTDKKDELLVITAHYDHIGVENGVVYNGADDDGTGTVAILEIAEAFAMAKAEGHGPRRSVLVMPVSGEEKGLLGSSYYSDHPVFPLASTIANLNIDMIGRRDSSHMTSDPYIYVIGSDRLSTDLHVLDENANSTYTKLDLDYTFNSEDDPNRFYYRSDHYNFAKKGVPSIFYFSGVHEDYHQPTDDVEKILFDLYHQRTLLVFHTAWLLANATERPTVDKPLKP